MSQLDGIGDLSPGNIYCRRRIFIAAGIGALLHDIDTEHSTVSNKHRVISFLFGCFVLTGDLPIHFLRVEYFFLGYDSDSFFLSYPR